QQAVEDEEREQKSKHGVFLLRALTIKLFNIPTARRRVKRSALGFPPLPCTPEVERSAGVRAGRPPPDRDRPLPDRDRLAPPPPTVRPARPPSLRSRRTRPGRGSPLRPAARPRPARPGVPPRCPA